MAVSDAASKPLRSLPSPPPLADFPQLLRRSADDDTTLERPESNRRSTEPSPTALLQGYFTTSAAGKHKSSSHRNKSPFSRSHLRSRSSGSALSAPPMTRAHSMPAVRTASRAFDSSASPSLSPSPPANGSPQRSPARVRSPLCIDPRDSNPPPPRSPHGFETTNAGTIHSIQEDSELDITPGNFNSTASPGPTPPVAVFTRSTSGRRRPPSPLYTIAMPSPSAAPTSYPASVMEANASLSSGSASSSPALAPAKYNETFPSQFSLHHYASTSSFSSISSTPSSARSRSPSISSLEPIEDAPDAESEALEDERIMHLRLAAERSERGDDSNDDPVRRKSLDVSRGFGFVRGRGAERKRWSICGGERRADLDLETIWED